MSFTWSPDDAPPEVRITVAGWLRAGSRMLAMCVILLTGVLVTAALRPPESFFWGLRRPWTPYITQAVCRATLVVLGLAHRIEGRPMPGAGAVVANHSSWLDIFALNARKRVYFVSKSEVAGWPGIGLLARLTGTVFIDRDPRQARHQTEIFEGRLQAGHRLLFFPEGTSTDGLRVLPFRSTLFQAFFAEGLRDHLRVQPVSVIYQAPPWQDRRFYGWWGDMSFGSHMLKVLSAARCGAVTVVYHAPVDVSDFPGRKALATHCEAAVRAGMPPERRVAD